LGDLTSYLDRVWALPEEEDPHFPLIKLCKAHFMKNIAVNVKAKYPKLKPKQRGLIMTHFAAMIEAQGKNELFATFRDFAQLIQSPWFEEDIETLIDHYKNSEIPALDLNFVEPTHALVMEDLFKMSPQSPQSCDTFVVLPDKTKGGVVIFGKNSDRPAGEVQEIIYEPAADHSDDALVQCTYIQIPQVAHTQAVVLSKPAWMWGAEMGANEKGVVVGNEAVWTNALDGSDEKKERLLGMDMVRLSLERSTSASEAVDVLVSLLETHGQGGPCSDTDPDLLYHNSFLVADPTEAWVLETAGNLWVAQKITEGYRNISNCLSIGTEFDRSSGNLLEVTKEKGWWDGEGDFNFTTALSSGSDTRRKVCGEKLLSDLSKDGTFSLHSMLTVLRDDASGICMANGDFISTGSQVSVLTPPGGSGGPSCHWFTGTPDPQRSVFKPFVFTPNARISPFIQSPEIENDPAKTSPRFSREVDRSHLLYRRQQAALKSASEETESTLRQLEEQCIEETLNTLAKLASDSLSELDDLFKDCVDSELKFYK
ncbi:Peptidase C69 dipeptidase A, partial [Trinorchestia longiramus]